MLVKIGFQVVSCSGEDERYRVQELNFHGPTVRGWRSPINCHFPQEIILRLEVLAVLKQIQILVHQYLIPRKIEICTNDDTDIEKSITNFPDEFNYLGFITFSDNKATGFRSRELKSILIPSKKAKFVKLVIYENHANNKNVFNQVGIIGINILGDEIDPGQQNNESNNNFFHHWNLNHSSNSPHNSNYISPYDDLAFEMYVDEETAQIIKFLVQKKQQAILKEDFELANLLKITLENLRAAGEILGLYEQEKKQAIQVEDFDRAKFKKLQIDDFRKKLYSSLNVDQLVNGSEDNDCGYLPHSDNLNNNVRSSFKSLLETKSEDKFLDNKMSTWRNLPLSKQNMSYLMHSKSQTSFSNFKELADISNTKNQKFSSSFSNPQLHQYLHDAQEKNFCPKGFQTVESQTHACERSPSQTSSLSDPEFTAFNGFASESLNYSSLPIMSSEKGNQAIEPEGESLKEVLRDEIKVSKKEATEKKRILSYNTAKSQSKSVTTGSNKSTFEIYEDRMLPALKNYRGNEIVRECQLNFDQHSKTTLNEKERKQALLPISVFGMEMTEKFYSKSFNEKEEGLSLLKQKLKKIIDSSEDNNEVKDNSYNKVARAAIFLLHRALRDKVYSVYSSAAETIRFFFSDFVPQRVSSSEVGRSVEKLLPELLTKSGDVTPRIHNMAAHTILSIAESEEVRRLNIIPTHLSRPLMSSVHPRLALSRLEMVEQLILNHGISKDKKSGLTSRTLAEFGSSGLHHPAEAVRKVSERILIHVYKVNPRIVRKQLPPDDNVTRRNLLYRQLFQEFDFMDIQSKIAEQEKMSQRHIFSSKINDKQHLELGSDRKEFSIINNGCISNMAFKTNTKLPNFDNQLQTAKNCMGLNQLDKSATYSSLPTKYTVSKVPLQTQTNGGIVENSQKSSAMKPKVCFENVSNTLIKNPNSRTSEKRETNDCKSPHRYMNSKNNVQINEHIKFPNLIDSLGTTKARFILKQNKNTKSKQMNHSPSRNETDLCNEKASLLKKNFERNKNVPSGIPLPTFRFVKKHYNSNQKTPDKSQKSKQLSIASKTKSGDLANVKQLKQPVPGTWESLKTKNQLEMSITNGKEKKENTSESDKNNSEKFENYIRAKNSEQTFRFSGSMLASIKENEHSAESSSDEQDEKRRTYKSCIFCMSSEKWETENSLNTHYLKKCPMLTTCDYCTEVIEISGFTNHLLYECIQKHLFQMCRNCQKPVLADLLNAHDCNGTPHNPKEIQCPFCHEYIGNNENCWRNHFIGKNICLNHPRLL